MKISRTKTLFIAVIVALLGSSPSFATEDQPPQIQLAVETIKKITTTESRGDELYFSITEYSSIERPRTYLVPNFPTHWLSDHLAELNNVVLWQKPVREDESVMLVISLIERDAPPWNVDDLIGTIKLKVQYQEGKLKKEWQIPNREEVEMSSQENQLFLMTGDNGKYEVDLKLGEN